MWFKQRKHMKKNIIQKNGWNEPSKIWVEIALFQLSTTLYVYMYKCCMYIYTYIVYHI